MKLDDLYDNKGQDGKDNAEAFKRLPLVFRYFIESQHKILISKVRNRVRNLYGEEGLKDLVKSSGFRSYSTNVRHNGISDSLHLVGLAADFLKVGIFKDNPIPVCCSLECIDSGKCWHVQFRRG